MNASREHRIAASTGVVLATLAACYWLGSTRLDLDRASDAGHAAADTLFAAWMMRALAVCVLSSRIAALRGWWPAVATNLSLIAPSWPLISLAWSASTASLANVVAAEALLVAAGTALPVIGVVLRRLLSDEQRAEMTGTTLGVILAAVLWSRDLTSFLVLA